MTKSKKTHGKNEVYYDKDNEKIYTSLDNIIGAGQNLDFIRDPERLLIQYDHLIKAIDRDIIQEFPNYFKREVDQKDLFATIKETFINLVLEYDYFYVAPNYQKGVDFTGYIDKNLRGRVREGYTKRKIKKDNFINLLKDVNLPDFDMSVQSEDSMTYLSLKQSFLRASPGTKYEGAIIDYRKNYDEIINDRQEILDFITREVELNALDYLVLDCFFDGIYNVTQITRVAKQFGLKNGESKYYTMNEVSQAVKDLKDYLLLKYHEGGLFNATRN